ncbi:hypothetical protein F5B18DRAFT_245379 [Nemania serpens]|nr:hypothetical protein F5B18DRAFT_245379 [Nemania serpens]
MLASVLIFSLFALVTAVSAGAIPERRQQGGLARRQRRTGAATISSFSFGPSSTVYLGGGLFPGATSSSEPASATPATSPAESKARSTASGTVAVTGTIPTFSYFPSSTIPVSLHPTSQPSKGTGSGNQNGNGAGSSDGDGSGNKASNGTAGGDGGGSSNDGQDSQRANLADLLRGILDLLGD